MRMAAHQRHFEHRVLERGMRLLWNDGKATSDLTLRHARQPASVERDCAAVGRENTSKQLEQRRLATSVGADESRERPAIDGDTDLAQRLDRFDTSAPVVCIGNAIGGKEHGLLPVSFAPEHLATSARGRACRRRRQGQKIRCEVSWLAEPLKIQSVFPYLSDTVTCAIESLRLQWRDRVGIAPTSLTHLTKTPGLIST